MSKTLVCFVGIHDINVYLNSICHFTDKYAVNRIILVSLVDYSNSNNLNNPLNDLIFNDLLVQFRYVFESGFELTYREISIYETARKIILKNSKIVDVAYPMFEKQFKEIIGDLESESIIFDITALPKNVSIDIISKLMSLGLNNIVLLNVKESEFALYHTLVRQSSLEVRSYFQKDYFSKKYDKRLFKCSKIVKLIALFFAELIEYWPIVKVIFMAFSTFSI